MTDPSAAKRILLSGVFGPFGVDDEYGRKENIMELFHNQVTRAQGAASFRLHHRSFGLYFLAENIDADVTVLDFPSRKRFIRELRRGYDMVGISFITPNFVKAREMARLVREHSPGTEIILGGHGAAIEGVDTLIDCDHVVQGEGIRWLRAHLDQDPDAPIVHPVLPSHEMMNILGMPVPGHTSGLLVPGVGCVNACSFCCTSHFFGKSYSPFIESGRELFETAARIVDETGSDNLFVMDENFLKNRERALELVEQMERHRRFFRFQIFSSAEAITAFGLDNMVRLGVSLVWIGFESQSRQTEFAKNVGIDPRKLVQDLRDRGIAVLGSGILCMEHHTPDNIQQDIDFLVGLEADLVQFMLLIPLPVTALYQRLKKRGWLREDQPFEEWHGQKILNFRHPSFTDQEAEAWLKRAFRQDFEQNSSSMFRVTETALRGIRHLEAMPHRDANHRARLEQFREQARFYAMMLPAVADTAVNELERQRAKQLDREVSRNLGGYTWFDRVKQAAIRVTAARWQLRMKLLGDMIQPPTLLTHYKPGRGLGCPVRRDGVSHLSDAAESLSIGNAAAVATR